MIPFQSVAARVVDEALQERFAALSGDRNPMHMDPIAARRTQAGLPVVHGVHTLLWALETLVGKGQITGRPARVRCSFLKWVYLGDVATLSVPEDTPSDPAMVQVDVLGMTVLTAQITYGDGVAARAEAKEPAVSPAEPLPVALDLSFADLAERSGVAYTATTAEVHAFFPRLSAAIGAAAVAEMAACSYIVGMEAPGLHSMFSKLDLTIAVAEPGDQAGALSFLVTYQDERFRKARIGVSGRGVSGTLEVFVRNPPVEQATMHAVAGHVEAAEFAGMRALIVGGSRGLGELAAKLVAAGGGTPTVTYAMGKAEAERIVEQIGAGGGAASALPYDVLQAPGPQLARVGAPYTHLLYFATNPIFRPKGPLVSPPILAAFSAFYLQGFHDLCIELTKAGRPAALTSGRLIAYYPSSVAVEERPAGMTEYAMIKAAGEQMCRDLNQYVPGLHIVTTRLPRLQTDQTAGVIPGRDIDPVSVLLPILRNMRELASEG